MMEALNTPWHVYALMAELARRLEESQWFTKTAIEKMVYLLQEVYGVECGYDFQLRTHGPFAKGLIGDLGQSEVLEAVRLEYSQFHGYGTYRVFRGPRNDTIREKASDFLNRHSSVIERAVAEFGSLTTQELSLRSTIVYADRDLRRAGKDLTRDEFINLMTRIRPLTNREAIVQALSRLEENGHVERRREHYETSGSAEVVRHPLEAPAFV